MKFNKIFILLLGLSMGLMLEAYKVTVQNATQFKVRVITKYKGESAIACKKDDFVLESGQERVLSTGVCMLTRITAIASFHKKFLSKIGQVSDELASAIAEAEANSLARNDFFANLSLGSGLTSAAFIIKPTAGNQFAINLTERALPQAELEELAAAPKKAARVAKLTEEFVANAQEVIKVATKTLLQGAKEGDNEAVKMAIGAGADINAQDSHGNTALMLAAINQDAPMLEYLITKKSNANLRNKVGETAQDLLKKHKKTVYPPETYAVLGLTPNATDAEILGITKKELENKAAVKKAYNQLALTWHPDKNDRGEAKTRYSNLSETEREERARQVFQLIRDAYQRHA